ncbi:MAG TPA: AMP-binding protein, partial [Acidimicrobiia bacterium]|nr:AMP-binding protein [Acidimicrobiia bacterium]
MTDKAAQMPREIFLLCGDQRLTYAAVSELVTARVVELGDRSGTQIVVRPRLDFESVVELLAIPRTGASAVVVGPNRPDTDQLISLAGPDRRPSHTILFTSGSGGEPKGVRLAATNWEATARASMEHLKNGAGDRWLCVLPLHHVGGLSILYRSLYGGGTVVLESDLDRAGGWLDRVAIASLVPTQLYRLLNRRTEVFRSAPMVLLGGGPSDPVLVGRAGDAGLKILRTYGMTETTSQVATAREPGGPMFPLPGMDIAIGPEGRIEISGPIVMTGYVGESDLGGGFLTSDYGVIHSDGSLEVLGRADRVIITGGEKVNPEAIESLVTRHPGVTEVIVIGIPDSEWGERVVAVFVGDVDSSDLHKFLRTSVPAYSLPKQWVQVEALPRTDLGKVDAAAVRRL